jgi:inhibitor of KinA sporulation pathway (predicted exonuclease)
VLNPVLTNFSIELTGIMQDTVDTAPTILEALPLYLAWLRGHGLIDTEGQRVGHWQVVTWGDVDVMTILRRELLHKGVDFPPFFNQWINLKADSMFKKHFGVSACMLARLSDPCSRHRVCAYHLYLFLSNVKITILQYEPRGGLRHCVESIGHGVTWEGRAHDGLVDSINTAKICVHMANFGFRYALIPALRLRLNCRLCRPWDLFRRFIISHCFFRFVKHTRALDRNGIPFGSTGQKFQKWKKKSK